MLEIWEQANNMFKSVKIDNAVIYKGVKVVKDDDGIRVYSTETDFYTDMTYSFVIGTFEESLIAYLKRKYMNKLSVIEDSIQKEINGKRNHKRYNYLKKLRETYLNKYNEINTKEITGR
jgi:hypothetical protein